jgi:o-succinylbenzoate synthase
MKAHFIKYELQFKRPALTSRGEYISRPVWYLFLEKDGLTGIGECAPLPGLSKETSQQVEQLLKNICIDPETFLWLPELTEKVPSVRFAIETAWFDLKNRGIRQLFPSDFSKGRAGIPINGLIWMGDAETMRKQVYHQIKSGFRCIKLKIGGIDFEKEIELLQAIRRKYSSEEITIRLDANGAFSPDEAPVKLERLARLQIHSIEQPIAAGQWEAMTSLCQNSPVPVALDEELIGITTAEEKKKMLDIIHPQFLVLKPSLHGGFSGCREWIETARLKSINWWISSYLESNIGLNAIAQWAYYMKAKGHQGLGTGRLFLNNLPSPLEIRGEELWLNAQKAFHLPENFFSE